MEEEKTSRIKEFSKENFQDERDALANEINEIRSNYFENKEDINSQIERLSVDTKEKEDEILSLSSKVKEAGEQLQACERSLISKLINSSKTKKLRAELESNNLTKKEIEAGYIENQELKNDFHEQLENKEELGKTESLLEEFYKKQGNEYEKDKKERDIENISSNHDVLFVHGILLNPDSSFNNSLLRDNIDWDDKLDILLSLEPSISTSTISEGDNRSNFWAPQGVILGSGSVIDASRSDIGTQPENIKKRTRATKSIFKNIDSRIEDSIRNKSRCNELTVEKPKIAGLYYVDNEDYNVDSLDHDKLFEISKKRNLPVYNFMNGVPYEANYDEKNKKFVSQYEVDKKDIFENQSETSKEDLDDMVSKICKNYPFKLKDEKIKEEIDCLNYFSDGEEFYIENLPKTPDSYEQEYTSSDKIFISGAGERKRPTRIDEKYKIISNIVKVGKVSQYILTESGELYETGKNALNGIEYINSTKDSMKEQITNHIALGHFYSDLEVEIYDMKSYLNGMENTIIELGNEKKQRLAEGKATRNQEEDIRNHALHLLGVSKKAEEFGDTDTQKKAIEIAEKYISRESVNEIKNRRIDDEGRVKITPKEFEIINK